MLSPVTQAMRQATGRTASPLGDQLAYLEERLAEARAGGNAQAEADIDAAIDELFDQARRAADAATAPTTTFDGGTRGTAADQPVVEESFSDRLRREARGIRIDPGTARYLR